MVAGAPGAVEASLDALRGRTEGARPLLDEHIRADPDGARLLASTGTDRAGALLATMRRLGRVAEEIRRRQTGDSGWSSLHVNSDFVAYVRLARLLLARRAPQLDPDQWACVLEEVAKFPMIWVADLHEYLPLLIGAFEKQVSTERPLPRRAHAAIRSITEALRHPGRALETRLLIRLREHGARVIEGATAAGVPATAATGREDPFYMLAELEGQARARTDDGGPWPVFPAAEGDRLRPVYRLVGTLFEAARTGPTDYWVSARSLPESREILGHPSRHDAFVSVLRVLTWCSLLWRRRGFGRATAFGPARALDCLRQVLDALARGDPRLSPAEAAEAYSFLELQEGSGSAFFPSGTVIHAITLCERRLKGEPSMTSTKRTSTGVPRPVSVAELLSPGEAWSNAAIEHLGSHPAKDRWVALLAHAKTASGSEPSGKWLGTARSLVEGVGSEEFARTVAGWFTLVESPRAAEPDGRSWRGHPLRLADRHMDLLRGLCWACTLEPDRDLARALGRLAITAYRKIPGVGPRAVKVGNAAITALGWMPGRDAVGHLAMLRVKVKFGTAQKMIEKAIGIAAAREGLSVEEIDELGVPTYGLTRVGLLEQDLGGYRVEAVIDTRGGAALSFRKVGPDGAVGKPQKWIPSAVKENAAEGLRELKGTLKDIGAMVPAQRDRLDSMFLERRSWPIAVWRERYLDHPLVGILARRLIWQVESRDGGAPGTSVAWLEEAGGLVDAKGEGYAPAGREVVRLWHPIEARTEEVMAWRAFFEERQIRQPFKQAHREVYLLTDAERRTRTYSNRFAAHIVKQHQFHALCGVRGWKDKLRLVVVADCPPATRNLSAWGLRAEFWVEGAGGDPGNDANDAGVFLYLATDQVRFYQQGPRDQGGVLPAGAGFGLPVEQGRESAGLPLEDVPPLVFSEVMRDVDLFVGVCSVANNPQWSDGGPGGAYREYWWSHSFGELSQSGAGRRDLLARLIPRLRIAPVCTLQDRFLRVQGKRRGYKIHLGSGNILMEPNDEYLCIVPGSGDGVLSGEVFLPFEGDRALAIILSKAFMLAADDQIKDPTITRQITGR